MTLAAPTNLSVSNVGPGSADLSWTDNSSSNNGYKVYKSTDGGSTWNLVSDLGANVSSETLSGLLNGEQYRVLVVAYNGTHSVADGVVVAGDGSVSSLSSPYTVGFTDIIRGKLEVQ